MNIKSLGMGLLLGFSSLASQAGVHVTADNTFGIFDATGGARPFPMITGATGAIIDVDIFIEFAKCDDPGMVFGQTGCPNNGEEFSGETYFFLLSPFGVRVDLVYTYNSTPEGTAQGSTTTTGTYDRFLNIGGRHEVTFDDDTAAAVGPVMLNGAFRPEELLSAFDGGNANGVWILGMGDSITSDPLSYVRACLRVETNSGIDSGGGCPGIFAIAEPGSFSLAFLSLTIFAALGVRRTPRTAGSSGQET